MDERVKQARAELGRRSFFEFCRARAPSFYKEGRYYIKELCQCMEDFLYSDKKVLLVNLPPRHGKSRTAQLFCQYAFGKNRELKIMTASYNETLSTMFSKNIRNDIGEAEGDLLVYSDIFPEVKIKKGDGAMNLWSLEGGFNNYLATSPKGSATGFGADIIIIDDIIKSADEALNDMVKDSHWLWFTDTMLSRLEKGGKIIVIMTRWAGDDLAGRILENMEDVQVFSRKAFDGEKMLCEDILDRAAYERKIRLTSKEIVLANYDQCPIESEGLLYGEFKTYDKEPNFYEVCAYVDTADEGKDYLCCIVFGISGAEAYVKDVLYTKEPMEITERKVAKILEDNKVNYALIESNNGGRGFARAVRDKMKTNFTVVKTFTQRANKATRILTFSAWVNEHIYFPQGWHYRWRDFYKSIATYKREGQNRHDDAEDALTGVAETVQRR